jgi:4-amino-4-deoxy-L-arabinose transferase-like glycosyltransferase
MKKPTSLLILHCSLFIAFLLRLINLNTRPLWYDEAFAVLFAEKGFSAMMYGTLTQVQGAAADVHPIAYYSILNLWMQFVGQSPFAVRMLSVFVGAITVAAVYAVAKELFSKRAALVAMLLTALSPFHVYYSQEARMYAPLALGCVLVVLFFIKANRDSRLEIRDFTHHASRNTQYAIRYTPSAIRFWFALSLSAAFALYMQNLAAFFLLAFGLSTLPRPKTFFKVALAGAGAFMLWLPWFVNITSQFAKLQQAYWVTRPNFVTLLQTLLIYHAGEEFVATAKAGVVLPLFAGIVVLVMLVVHLRIVPRPVRSLRPHRSTLWLITLAFGTPLLLFLASLYQPVYIQRALLPASLMYVLAISWLLAESKMPNPIRFALGGIVGVTFVAGLWAHYTFESFPRPSFQSAVSYLKQNLAQGDVIVHSNKLTYFPMYYYDRSLPQKFIADPRGSGSDTLALPTQEMLGLYALSDVQIAAGDSKHVWFVIFDRAVEEYKPNPHPHLEWMQKHYAQGQVKKFDDMTIYEFLNPKAQISNPKIGSWMLEVGY